MNERVDIGDREDVKGYVSDLLLSTGHDETLPEYSIQESDHNVSSEDNTAVHDVTPQHNQSTIKTYNISPTATDSVPDFFTPAQN